MEGTYPSAVWTAYRAEGIASRAFESDEFYGELVAMHRSLAAVTDRTQQPLEPTAVGANDARILALKRKCNRGIS